MCSQVYHGETAAPLELFEQIALRIAKSNLGETTRRFSTLHRASGTPDAEEAADYLLQKLEEYGIPHRRLRFTGYMSRAVDASLEMLSPQKTEFDVVPCGFTKNVTNLEGEVFYDALCEKERLTYQEQAERFRGAAGKFVLTKIYCSDVVLEAAAAGAIGVIGMYNGPGGEPALFWSIQSQWRAHAGEPAPAAAVALCRLHPGRRRDYSESDGAGPGPGENVCPGGDRTHRGIHPRGIHPGHRGEFRADGRPL